VKTTASAFAPATVANVAVGFDILGHALTGIGDKVTVSKIPDKNVVRIDSVEGSSTRVPVYPLLNTATAGLVQMLLDLDPGFGLSVSIKKGIPISSGMGGSAASAVAGIVAASALMPHPLSNDQLMNYALIGEAVASGSRHADNVAPCLLGGLCLVRSVDPIDILKLPVPADLQCVLIHPHIQVSTKHARSLLRADVALTDAVRQSANLAGFIAACYGGDLGLLCRSFDDVLIERQRKHLIPLFDDAKRAALVNGALGFSISGSGPSVFAWVKSEEDAISVRDNVMDVFERGQIRCDAWISRIATAPGAWLVE
jgi:homoserine kinase